MSVNFPTALDDFTNPTPTDYLNSPSHAGQHSNANDAIEALEAKVGINNSAVTTSHDYKIATLETGIATLETGIATLETGIATLETGWVLANGTWAASNADTISVNADLTNIIQKGDKLKLTNNSVVKYFYVSSVPVYSAPNTTFHVAGEVDLVAGSITSPYYSKLDNPQGFKNGKLWFRASASQSGSQNINDNTLTQITLGTENYDDNNNFASSTYTAPISGLYQIVGNGRFNNGDHIFSGFIYILKNGAYLASIYIDFFADPSTGIGGSVVRLARLNKGDTIGLYASVDTDNGSQITVSDCHLDVQFISV